MKKRREACLVILFLLFIAHTFIFAATPQSTDPLYEGFVNPPASARPFVRWWWNDNRVTSEETLRELDVMKDAGIGGVEMNPISAQYASEESKKMTRVLEWLRPEWNDILKITAEGARERDMIPDMIVGSGWPSGARFLESGEQIQIIITRKIDLKGPGQFVKKVDDLMEASIPMGGGKAEKIKHGSEPKLVFLRLVPQNAETFQTGRDVLNKVNEKGWVQFDIPEGAYVLYVGSWREGYRQVTGGVLGADGPVIDHFNGQILRKYLDRISNTLNPYFDGKMGNAIRAMFFDSFELGHTNWTNDFKEQFKQRRGYDLTPYLHFMVDLDPISGDNEFTDTIKRLRYDFNITLAELFVERFMTTYTEWCNDNGMKSRAQAYGREGHPLNTSFYVDLPEGETWVWGAEMRPRPSSINRFVASAAHLDGKSLISAESMTNPFTPFRVLYSKVKQTDDLNFISGITHSILHGYNYSPPELGWPGWVRFGTYFSEYNSLWPYFRNWSDYNARISYVLQNSKAQARVAILTPEADIASNLRPYHPFADRDIKTPWYIYDLWEALHQNGFNVEYTSDRIIQEATFESGKINVRNKLYDVLLLERVETLDPKTALQLEKLAKSGGKIVFIGKAPHRAPSFVKADDNDNVVKQAIQTCLKQDPKVAVVNEPEKDSIIQWAGDLMKQFKLEPDVRFSIADSQLSQIYHKAGDKDIFFIAWSDTVNPVQFTATFHVEGKIPYLWDPEKATRFKYPVHENNNVLDIHLEPCGSMLLVFESENLDLPTYTKPVIPLDNILIEIDQWQATFKHHVKDETFMVDMNPLMDVARSKDDRLNQFGGVITYKAKVTIEDPNRAALNLGKVYGISEVEVNGKNVGVHWYGRPIFDLGNAIKKGENEIIIKVTTHMGNYARKFPRKSHAGRYAWWYPIDPVGLLGPVQFIQY